VITIRKSGDLLSKLIINKQVIKSNTRAPNPKTIPPGAKYSHTVWGVDINEHPLVAVNGRKHFNSVPVLVYKKPVHQFI